MQKGQIPLLVLAGIVLLIAVAGGIFFLGRITLPRQDSSGQATPKPQAPVVTSTSKPTPSPLANWEILKNSTYGYTLKYPDTWKFIGSGMGISETDQNAPLIIISDDPKDTNYNYPTLSIDALDKPGTIYANMPLVDIVNIKFNDEKSNRYTYLQTVRDPETLTLDGKQAYTYTLVKKVSIFRQGKSQDSIIQFKFIMTENKNNFFTITIHPSEDILINQILSTFRFD